MIPAWLHNLSIVVFLLAVVSAVVVLVDVLRYPQRMWIMNVVWPVVCLFGSLAAALGYFCYGRLTRAQCAEAPDRGDRKHARQTKLPFAVMVGKGAAHCGAGCTLGDICAEWLAFCLPGVAIAFGWHTLVASKMFAVWILDYVFAYGFGIVFQYFSIAPMRGLSVLPGIWAAIKADTLSLTAWQVGMYGYMAIAAFGIFHPAFGVELKPDMVEFWFMVQIAMLCGFATAYPVNWWLIRSGLKEEM